MEIFLKSKTCVKEGHFKKYKLIFSILWFFKYEQLATLLHYSFILVFTYNICFIPKKIETASISCYLVVVFCGLIEL